MNEQRECIKLKLNMASPTETGYGETNVVYAAIVSCPGLIYAKREKDHKFPVVIKVGMTSASLFHRYRQHKSARGFDVLETVALVRRPREGVANTEKKLKAALEGHRLRVGTLSASNYSASKECYEATPEVLEIIHRFVERYTKTSNTHPADGHMVQYEDCDPLEIAEGVLSAREEVAEGETVAALEVSDAFTPKEEQILAEVSLTTPLSIISDKKNREFMKGVAAAHGIKQSKK